MDPWTQYWQADHLQSCVPASAQGSDELNRLWVRFGRSLPAKSRLIDLATGNGAVPAALVSAGVELDITAVDKAAVDPQRYLRDPSVLRGVRLRGGIDLTDPSVLHEHFDAVTSQFGVEYLPPGHRGALLARLLQPGGRFLLVVHHERSDVVQPRRRDLAELDRLFAPGAVMDGLLAFARDAMTAKELTSLGHVYLAQPGLKTERLSGQLFSALEHILSGRAAEHPGPQQLAADVHARVSAEAERLRQLLQAAMDEPAIDALAADLGRHELTLDLCAPLHLEIPQKGSSLVGWQVAGRRL